MLARRTRSLGVPIGLRRGPFERFSPYYPPIRANLELFLDPSSPDTSVIAGAVAQLGDRSGKARHFTQSTGASRPTFNTSDALFGGRPSMSFDAVNDYLASSSFNLGSALTIYTTMVPGAGTGRFLVSLTAPRVIQTQPTATSVGAILNDGANATRRDITVTAGVAQVVTSVYKYTASGSSALPSLYVNAVDSSSAVSTAYAATSPVASVWNIGGDSVSGSYFGGRMAGTLVYSEAHTAAQVALVTSWMKWRNAL
jgi:hypothetical protein